MVKKTKKTIQKNKTDKTIILLVISIIVILIIIGIIITTNQSDPKIIDDSIPAQIIVEPEINDNVVDEIIPNYDSAVETQSVRISAGHFNPDEILINVGDTVTWRNDDSITHTITSNTFSSENLGKSVFYTHTFDTPGVYEYHCKYHTNETGRIIVQ